MALDDSYTKSLLHFDGADASTTFTDEGGKTWTAGNQAQLDTAQFKFGSASLLLDGNADYITTADHDDWYVGSGDFSLDFWVRFAALPVTPGSGDYAATFWSQCLDDTNKFLIALTNSGGNYYINMFFRQADTTVVLNSSIQWSTPAINTWYHIAIVRTGNTLKRFINGVALADDTFSGSIDNIAGAVKIGGNTDTAQDLNGWIDEFRWSKGIARWTANFTPPTSPYPILPTGNAAVFLSDYGVI